MGFRDDVETDEWLAEVGAWVADQVALRGWQVTGPVDQRRVRPWSTQVVVRTDHGSVWFKAASPRLAFEAGVHAVLARLVPDQVDEPLGVDADRGWLLTADRGRTLRDREGLTEEDVALPSDHPSHLDSAAVQEVAGFRSAIQEAAAQLDEGELPSSFQHGDAHPGNVFAVERGLRLFDFGDAQWAHVLESLAVPYGVALRAGLPWGPLQAAYAERWADVVDADELDRLLHAAVVTHAVNRAQLWLWSVDDARPDELAEWGDGAAYFLRSALDPFAP